MDRIKMKNAAEALLEKEKIEVLTQGNSMAPFLKEHRDIAVIEVPKALRAGDVVLYTRDKENFVLHRIMKVKGEDLVIRGDNNLNFERDIKKEDIIGLLTAVYRKGKYINAKSLIFKMFGLFSRVRFPFIFVYRKTKQFLWKKLKAKR